MALYLIGDVQGCDGALQRLLDTISFSPSRDTLHLLGDLVNRGPDSAAVLRRLPPGFDVASVDGSHVARDVLTDAVLTWPLLKSGGLLIFDDYGWNHPDRLQQPRPAIDAFVDLFAPELELIHMEYRVIVRKK